MIRNRKGFTLIELLVVITIIGILSVGGFSQTQKYIAKARDSQRQQGISQYVNNLELYALDNINYPKVKTLTASLVGGDYLRDLVYDPRQKDGGDPQSSDVSGEKYVFIYATGTSVSDPNSDRTAYEISAHYESASMRKNWHKSDDLSPGVGNTDDNRYEKSSLNEAITGIATDISQTGNFITANAQNQSE